jgi:hypothetical protein
MVLPRNLLSNLPGSLKTGGFQEAEKISLSRRNKLPNEMLIEMLLAKNLIPTGWSMNVMSITRVEGNIMLLGNLN